MQAEGVARSISDPDQEAWALAQIARSLAEAGNFKDAERLANSIRDPQRRVEALAQVAIALAKDGQHELAEKISHSIHDPYLQAEATARVADALAGAGLYLRAEQMASSIAFPFLQADAMTRVVRALGATGQHEQANSMAEHAEQAIRSINNPDQQAEALAQLAGVLTGAGQYERARALPSTPSRSPARSITRIGRQARSRISQMRWPRRTNTSTPSRSPARSVSQTSKAWPWTAGGYANRSRRISVREQVARGINDPDRQAGALVGLVEALTMNQERLGARRIAAVACAVGRWSIAAKPVLMLDPSSRAPLAQWVRSARIRAIALGAD